MAELKALLIEWNPHTGKRAGGINPRDKNLRCNGWQNMDVSPAIELRLVEDNGDLGQYRGVTGVTMLDTAEDINAAIDANFPSKIVVEDELLYSAHFKSKVNENKINIDDLSDEMNSRLIQLKNVYGVKGIKEIHPQKV